MKISNTYENDNECTLYHGDCFELLDSIQNESVDLVVTSPPYCIGKSYEKSSDNIETFIEQHKLLFPKIYGVLKNGGSLCWQVGYQSSDAEILPLDFVVYDLIKNQIDKEIAHDLKLRNRIVWTFGHGLNAKKRFSGRHETILWFTKGNQYEFDLDSVRVPQKYPGKKYYKGSRKGEYSCNKKGKNPSDVWDIPNVKANHVEKTSHPCQFPISIPTRLIRALTPQKGLVLDPFMGVGTTGAAAILEGRRFVGSEIDSSYFKIAESRIISASKGELRYREDAPVNKPNTKMAVARRPVEFDSEESDGEEKEKA